MLVQEPDVRGTSHCGTRDGHEHGHGGGVAVGDEQDEESRQIDHHPDGELYHGLLPFQLLDAGVLVCAGERLVEVPVGFSRL